MTLTSPLWASIHWDDKRTNVSVLSQVNIPTIDPQRSACTMKYSYTYPTYHLLFYRRQRLQVAHWPCQSSLSQRTGVELSGSPSWQTNYDERFTICKTKPKMSDGDISTVHDIWRNNYLCDGDYGKWWPSCDGILISMLSKDWHYQPIKIWNLIRPVLHPTSYALSGLCYRIEW